jgi:dTDP-4-amino-4,6-dideoxygalactose transaminase
VIVPALTFYATASAVIFLNAVPVIVDVDEDTFGISPEAIEAAITDRTRAIIPVHLGATICDLDAILDIAERHDLIVVEDCAHMHGGMWRGRGVGSWGHAGAFSLQQSKGMTAGEGGITITSDPAIDELCHSLINCGRFREEDTIRTQVLGWNYRLTELQAAILKVQLSRLPEQLETKRANCERLEARLREIEGLELLEVYDGVTARAFYTYPFKYVGQEQYGLSREALCRSVRAEGIPLSAGVYPPLNRLPLYTDWEQRSAKAILGHEVDVSQYECPAAERIIAEHAMQFAHQLLLAEPAAMDDIADAIEKVLDHAADVPSE